MSHLIAMLAGLSIALIYRNHKLLIDNDRKYFKIEDLSDKLELHRRNCYHNSAIKKCAGCQDIDCRYYNKENSTNTCNKDIKQEAKEFWTKY